MKIVVLLSAGLHPVSARPCPVPVELQAIGLANRLFQAMGNDDGPSPGGTVIGLHAGAGTASVRDCLGHGLSKILMLEQSDGDPAAALEAAILDAAPDLVLAGRRGRGGGDSGLLPYRLATMLGWPICADGIALARHPAGLTVTQALPRGARRRVALPLPSLVTVHSAAPPPATFAFAAARRGTVATQLASFVPGPERPAASEHPYRKRPQIMRGPKVAGTAEDRLKAATEISGGGRILVNPPPEEAATAICALLEKLGLLP